MERRKPSNLDPDRSQYLSDFCLCNDLEATPGVHWQENNSGQNIKGDSY